MDTKTISAVGDKGGIGKSTVNLMMAINLISHFKKKVIVVDVDDPQYSLKRKQRREMKQHDVSEEELPYEMVCCTTDVLPKVIQKYSGKVDFIIIDFPGVMSKETAIGMHFVQYIFIPFTYDDFEIDSTLLFYKRVVKHYLNNDNALTTSVQGFFNKYMKVKKNKFHGLREKLKKANIQQMDSVVLHRTIYVEKYRSSLFPIPKGKEKGKHEFLNFIKEVIKITQ